MEVIKLEVNMNLLGSSSTIFYETPNGKIAKILVNGADEYSNLLTATRGNSNNTSRNFNYQLRINNAPCLIIESTDNTLPHLRKIRLSQESDSILNGGYHFLNDLPARYSKFSNIIPEGGKIELHVETPPTDLISGSLKLNLTIIEETL